MKHIYITAIPLASNFSISKLKPTPVNCEFTDLPAAYFPIIPFIEKTMRPGDEAKVITVRQTNQYDNPNFDLFLDELKALKLEHCTLHDIPLEESQEKDTLLSLYSRLLGEMEPDCCYHACMTFGAKTYAIVLFSVLAYAQKILPDVEISHICYREVTRKDGGTQESRIYDMVSLFTLNQIVDNASHMQPEKAEAFIKMLLK